MIMGLERLERITGFTEEALRGVPESPFAELLSPPVLPPSGRPAGPRSQRSQPGNDPTDADQSRSLGNGVSKRPQAAKSGKVRNL